MSAEATRMQDLASEFSKFFPGVVPPQREWATPSRTHPQTGLWPGALPGVGTQTLAPLNFSAVVAPLRIIARGCYHKFRYFWDFSSSSNGPTPVRRTT